MIDKTAISYQQTVISNQLSVVSKETSEVGHQQRVQYRNIEELKGRNDPAALESAAKELEALFAYEMIKAMRQTTESSRGGFGKDAYMSLFDMEISKVFAERGLGLKELLLKGLNRKQEKAVSNQLSAVSKETTAVSNQPSADSNQLSVVSKETTAVSDQQSAISKRTTEVSGQESALSNQSSVISDQIEGNSAWPSAEPSIPVDGTISSKFGLRRHPIYGDTRFHHGMDIAAPAGTEIYPYQRGKVIFSGEQAGYGNTVIIDHGNGYTSRYAHNRINLVKAGDFVDEDTIIAEVGSTGVSTGAHLHFEVRKDGKYLDPARVLALK